MKLVKILFAIVFLSSFISCAPDLMNLSGGYDTTASNTIPITGALLNKSGTALTAANTPSVNGWVKCDNETSSYGTSQTKPTNIYTIPFVLAQNNCIFYITDMTILGTKYSANSNNLFTKNGDMLTLSSPTSNSINVTVVASGINPITTTPKIDFIIYDSSVNSTTSTAITTGSRLPSVGTGNGFSCSLDYATSQSLNCWGTNANITTASNAKLTKSAGKAAINLGGITATELYVGDELICVTDNSTVKSLYCLGNFPTSSTSANDIKTTFTKIGPSATPWGSILQVALGNKSGCVVEANAPTAIKCFGRNSLKAGTVVNTDTGGNTISFGGTITSFAFGSDINNLPNDTLCAIVGGSVQCIGDNNFGQFGNGSTTSNYSVAQQVNTINTTAGVATAITGKNHSFCASTGAKTNVTASTYCWGQQNDFTIGLNTYEFNIWGALGTFNTTGTGGGSLYSTPLISGNMYTSGTGAASWTTPAAFNQNLTSPLNLGDSYDYNALGLGTLCGSKNYTNINCIGADILSTNAISGADSSSKKIVTNTIGKTNKVTSALLSGTFYTTKDVTTCTTNTYTSTGTPNNIIVFVNDGTLGNGTYNTENSCDPSPSSGTYNKPIALNTYDIYNNAVNATSVCNNGSCGTFYSADNSFMCSGFNNNASTTTVNNSYTSTNSNTPSASTSWSGSTKTSTSYTYSSNYCSGNYWADPLCWYSGTWYYVFNATVTTTKYNYKCNKCQYRFNAYDYSAFTKTSGPSACATIPANSSSCSLSAPSAQYYKIGDPNATNYASKTCQDFTLGTNPATPNTFNYINYTNTSTTPSTPSTTTPIYSMSMGVNLQTANPYSHGCAVLIDGTIKCWGNNDLGQAVPSNSATVISIPTLVP